MHRIGGGGNGAAMQTGDRQGPGSSLRNRYMFNVTTKSIQWGNETLTLETGKVARQADGSVIATLGETSAATM